MVSCSRQNQHLQNHRYHISDLCPRLTERSPFPSNWYHLIRNHLSRGATSEAVAHYTHIRREGIHGVIFLIPLILKACARLSLLNLGKCFHGHSVKGGVDIDVTNGTSLLHMYAKCGFVVDARKVFDLMPERNVVTWNAMIGGYLMNKDMGSALSLFGAMSERTIVTWNEMIAGLAQCGDVMRAREMFDQVPVQLRNAVTWTVMVDGYASNGEMEAAMEVFERMPLRCPHVWSSLVSGYCKKGDIEQARAIFDQIPVRNSVNWNSLISGFAQNGFCEEAIRAFRDMQADGFEPDEVTMASVLSACAQLGRLDFGKEIHQMIDVKGLKLNKFVLNGLIDMYVKCGDLCSAVSIFEQLSQSHSVCWNSMISGFAIHGNFQQAVEFFRRMVSSGGRPDNISVLSVLSACAHGGLVEEGLSIFSQMDKYGLCAGIKHYGCLIDLLARAGRLMDAFSLAKTMPMKPNDSIWGSILGACRVHSESSIAEQVLEHISNEGSGNHSHCVLLSNIYAASEQWEAAEVLRITSQKKGLEKIAGCSSLMMDPVIPFPNRTYTRTL